MRRAAKVDLNQSIIVDMFRKLGWSVEILSMVGSGMTDILVGKNGWNICCEIKKSSKEQLTPDQVIWHRDWRGLKCIVDSVEQVIDIDRKIRALPLFQVEIGRDCKLEISRIPDIL